MHNNFDLLSHLFPVQFCLQLQDPFSLVHVPDKHPLLHVSLQVYPYRPILHPSVQYPFTLSQTSPEQDNEQFDVHVFPQNPEGQFIQYPVYLSQVSSLQFPGHSILHLGPQYLSTQPCVQNPELSQALDLQVALHSKN